MRSQVVRRRKSGDIVFYIFGQVDIALCRESTDMSHKILSSISID